MYNSILRIYIYNFFSLIETEGMSRTHNKKNSRWDISVEIPSNSDSLATRVMDSCNSFQIRRLVSRREVGAGRTVQQPLVSDRSTSFPRVA